MLEKSHDHSAEFPVSSTPKRDHVRRYNIDTPNDLLLKKIPGSSAEEAAMISSTMARNIEKASLFHRIHTSADNLFMEISTTKARSEKGYREQGNINDISRKGLEISELKENNGMITFTLKSWGNSTDITIGPDGSVSLDGKPIPKELVGNGAIGENWDSPVYIETLRLANYLNSLKKFPDNKAKRFAEFRKVYFGS